MRRILLTLLSLVLAVSVAAGCSNSSTGSSSAGSTAGSTPTSSSQAAGATTGASTTGASGCPSSAAGFAKTKFLLHAGLGFGAFHRYIYKPFRAGSFISGAHGRIRAFLKAGAAALFVKREVRLAYEASKKSPALCKVVAGPLQKIGDLISGAVSKLKSGDTSGITAVESAVSAVKGQSANNGAPIKEDQNASI